MYQSLAEALTDLTQELKAEGKKLKIIPARLADDRLLLLFPGTSPRRAQLLTERLQAAYNRRMTTKGASGHDFCTKVTGYGPKEKSWRLSCVWSFLTYCRIRKTQKMVWARSKDF